MPIAKVQLPDGRIGRFEVPEGTTPDEVLQFAQDNIDKLGAPEKAPEPVADLTSPSYLMDEAGKYLDKTKRQLLGDGRPFDQQMADYAAKPGDDERMAEISRQAIEKGAAAIAPMSWLASAGGRLAAGAAAGAAGKEGLEDKAWGAAGGAATAGMFEGIPALQAIGTMGKRALYDPTWNPERVVGATMRRMAEDPTNPQVLDATIAALKSSQPLVRGSNPTAPQASGNAGLWGLYKTTMAREPAADRAVQDAQNIARLKAFKELGVGNRTLEDGTLAVQRQGNALKRDAVSDLNAADAALGGGQFPIDLSGVDDSIAGMLRSGAAKDDKVRSVLSNIRGKLRGPAVEADQVAAAPIAQVRRAPVVETETDDLLTAIRKLGGINKESAQNIYGNELWKDVQFAGHPSHGPVWRNGESGQPLDEMAKRLHEHGYLDKPDYGEMLDTLYEVSKGTADASRIWSRNKQSFGGIYGDEISSEKDDILSQLGALVDELRKKNGPKEPPIPRPLETNLEQVQGIKEAIGRMVYNPDSGIKIAGTLGNKIAGITGDVGGQIDDAIEAALMQSGNPGLHRSFREKYAQGVNMNRRTDVLADLLRKGSSPGMLPEIGEVAPGVFGPTGGMKEGEILSTKLLNATKAKQWQKQQDVLTPKQLARIDAIKEDLARNIPRDVKRGSDTYQNMAIDYLTSDILGAPGAGNTLFGGLSKGATWLAGKGLGITKADKILPSANALENPKLRELMVKALTDPQLAAQLIEAAKPASLLYTTIPARVGPSLIEQMGGQ